MSELEEALKKMEANPSIFSMKISTGELVRYPKVVTDSVDCCDIVYYPYIPLIVN